MKRTGIAVVAALLNIMAVNAQQITYNHDPMKKNQITVMESGTGALTPEWYYVLLHNNYRETASVRNKTQYRAMAGVHLFNQRTSAEEIDSALTKRAFVESLNMADRMGGTADLAWATEGPKLSGKMNTFLTNINRIMATGGTLEEREYWLQYYNVYQSAIRMTQDAYMPNAQRKREYLQIYSDVSRKNDLLVRYLVRINNRRRIQERLSALADSCKADKPAIINLALIRWQSAIGMTSGRPIEE